MFSPLVEAGLVGFCIRPNFIFFQKSQEGPNFINVLTWYQSDLVQLISGILNLSSKVFKFTKMKQFYVERVFTRMCPRHLAKAKHFFKAKQKIIKPKSRYLALKRPSYQPWSTVWSELIIRSRLLDFSAYIRT